MSLQQGELQNQVLTQETTEEERIKRFRAIEIAKGIASRFDTWIKRYNHPEQIGQIHLLDWLVAGRGAKYTGTDYTIFKALAEVLSTMGHQTLPSLSEGQFMAKIRENELVLQALAQHKK